MPKGKQIQKILTARTAEHMSVAGLGLQATVLQALFHSFFLEQSYQIPHLSPSKTFQCVNVSLKVCLIDHESQHMRPGT